jgi:hypothetical protein
MSRIASGLKVTAALAVLGAAVGALLGIVAIAFIALVTGGPSALRDSPVLFPAAATIGAGAGVVLGPVAAWTLMRHVPIWKAIAGTAAGTTIGFVIGYWLTQPLHLEVSWAIGAGLLGFLVSAVTLRLRKRRGFANRPIR